LNGTAPRDLAPSLFKLVRFKRRLVYTELQNDRWIKNLGPITTPSLLEEYIILFSALSTVTLSEQADQIFWRWTTSGKYTAASAY
jgi:hypothetical protein